MFVIDSKERFHDLGWVVQNSDDLYDYIKSAVMNPATQAEGVEVLLRTYPHLVHMDAMKSWHHLIKQTVSEVIHREPISDDQSEQEDYLISSHYILRRLNHEKTRVRRKTKRRPRFRVNARELYEDYLILLMTLFSETKIDIDERHITDVLDFARDVNNVSLYNKTYQTLAMIYASKGEIDHALDHAELAYRYFTRHKDILDAAITAYVLGTIYQQKGQFEDADQWLQIATDHITETRYADQFGAIALCRSEVCEQQGDYTGMRDHAQRALEQFTHSDLHERERLQCLAESHFLLGAAAAQLGDDATATEQFNAAKAIWQHNIGTNDQLDAVEQALGKLNT